MGSWVCACITVVGAWGRKRASQSIGHTETEVVGTHRS